MQTNTINILYYDYQYDIYDTVRIRYDAWLSLGWEQWLLMIDVILSKTVL